MNKIDRELGKKGIRGIFLKSYNKDFFNLKIGCLFFILFFICFIVFISIGASASDSEWSKVRSSPIFITFGILSIIFLFLTFPLILSKIFSFHKKNYSFYCPYPDCHKSIISEKIGILLCPNCDSKDEFAQLIIGCKKCSTILQYYECPYCKREINLFADYDENKIKTEIYHG